MKQGKTRVGRPTSFWDKQTKAYNQRVFGYDKVSDGVMI